MTEQAHEEIGLPPAFEKMLAQLKADRKLLMREKVYSDPAQLRAFVGQFLFARMAEMVELLGAGLYDTYGLAVSNANQLQRMRAVYSRELRKLGAEVGDGGELPGVSTEVLDELQQAFYALGTLLQKKLPKDTEVQDAYNTVAALLGETVSQLMGAEPLADDGDGDSEGDGEPGDDEPGDDVEEPGEGEPGEDESAAETPDDE